MKAYPCLLLAGDWVVKKKKLFDKMTNKLNSLSGS